MKKEEVIFDERYVGALTLTKVSKFYGDQNQVKALDNVSIQLFTGEFVVILLNIEEGLLGLFFNSII